MSDLGPRSWNHPALSLLGWAKKEPKPSNHPQEVPATKDHKILIKDS